MSKKIIFVLLNLLMFLTFFSNLNSQNPAGKWVNAQYGISLVLNADYTYTLTHSKGQSNGQWRGQGNQLCFYDSSGAQPVCYTVVAYTAKIITMRDINGVTLSYTRVAVNNTNSSNTIYGNNNKNGRVLANKNNIVLRYSDFMHGIDLVQFIIGGKIKPTEIEELRVKLIEEFNAQPSYILNQLSGIGNAMKKVKILTNPLQIGAVRQELFATFYKSTKNMNEAQKPLLIQVINRYIKVLAYDDVNKLILTNGDIDGYINCFAFNSRLAGRKFQLTKSLRNQIKNKLVNNFYSMDMKQKQVLASSSLIWDLLYANWSRMTQAQRQQYVTAYRAKLGNNYNNSYKQQANKGGSGNSWNSQKKSNSKKSLAQMRSEMYAKQNMYKMMSDMNMRSHALSLNIIENIGGTGNYWKVVDY